MRFRLGKPAIKPLEWVGSSKRDLIDFPEQMRKEVGHALHLAQAGEKPANAKPLRGFGGAGVLEVVASYDGNAFRAVYTVKFAKAIFVLHAFQKKATRAIETPKVDIELIKQRLNLAAEQYQQLYEGKRP